jgi:hypothetical protein
MEQGTGSLGCACNDIPTANYIYSQQVPAVIINVCKRRVRLRVSLGGKERPVNVNPDNVIFNEDG